MIILSDKYTKAQSPIKYFLIAIDYNEYKFKVECKSLYKRGNILLPLLNLSECKERNNYFL